MDQAAAQGWSVFFWAFDQQVNPAVKWLVYLVVFLAQLLCGLATVTSASRMIFAFSRDGGLPGSAALARSARPTAPRSPRSGLARSSRCSSSGVVAGLGGGNLGLHHRGLLHRDLPLSSFSIPIVLGLMAWGTPKWDKMGPWDLGRGVFTLFAVLSVISMILIFVIGVQPPNDWALYITVGFFILTAIVWFGFEKRRFEGPPIGEVIAKRQTLIREAERSARQTAPPPRPRCRRSARQRQRGLGQPHEVRGADRARLVVVVVFRVVQPRARPGAEEDVGPGPLLQHVGEVLRAHLRLAVGVTCAAPTTSAATPAAKAASAASLTVTG